MADEEREGHVDLQTPRHGRARGEQEAAPTIADFRIADRMMTSLTRHASMASIDRDAAGDKGCERRINWRSGSVMASEGRQRHPECRPFAGAAVDVMEP